MDFTVHASLTFRVTSASGWAFDCRGERFTVVESCSQSRGEQFTESWRAVHCSRSRVVESGSRSSRSRVVGELFKIHGSSRGEWFTVV
eukprot:3555595-Rhodomonas_salina.1